MEKTIQNFFLKILSENILLKISLKILSKNPLSKFSLKCFSQNSLFKIYSNQNTCGEDVKISFSTSSLPLNSHPNILTDYTNWLPYESQSSEKSHVLGPAPSRP